MTDAPIVELQDLKKTYVTGLRRKRFEAVKGLTLSVDKGEIFAIVGPNGAGKTSPLSTLNVSPPAATRASLGSPPARRPADSGWGICPRAPTSTNT